ncbi:MAG: hypothetical protein Q9227_003607 [Pyrenula ochraceoflavens]
MFRNEVSSASSQARLGRPPTPPSNNVEARQLSAKATASSPYFAQANRSSSLTDSRSSPVRVDHGNAKTPAKATGTTPLNSKMKFQRPNSTILNFFAKTDRPAAGSVDSDAHLFFGEGPDRRETSATTHQRSPSPNDCELGAQDFMLPDEEFRYNEVKHQSKRRKLSLNSESLSDGRAISVPNPDHSIGDTLNGQYRPNGEKVTASRLSPRKTAHVGGFIDDSDSDEGCGNTSEKNASWAKKGLISSLEDADPEYQKHNSHEKLPDVERPGIMRDSNENHSFTKAEENTKAEPQDCTPAPTDTEPLSLSHTGISLTEGDEFDELEDFETDEFFEEGEEYMERRFMEEQRLLEMEFDDEPGVKPEGGPSPATSLPEKRESVTNCPICNTSLDGLSESEASTHVNGCLDGKPVPLPLKKKSSPTPLKPPPKPTNGAKRFQRAAIARPAQENPDSLSSDGKGKSAFSRLMAGHAEDAAWAAAAANELKSRGRQAYERTCPFYKIMPGFFICVDAFRYGAVDGQKAYFLSHFHSDHYVGLTSSWSHGPIYCSKVTGNLVRQSLRVDPKWVVDLEFEKKVEVPGTEGVHVTMIPANHCPGSSLFLFEKPFGKGPCARVKRILHCGDFRACPAHVNHPLLRPETRNAVTGNTKDQIIDTCYLDTTYLTPKYAFPSQEDVIGACAQMCVSLSKEIVDSSDGWELAKRQRAGGGMVKFLDKAPPSNDNTLDAADHEEEEIKPKKRGRLLVVIGTYSIGKERICLGIARALNSKIYAPPSKQRVCACLEDPELNARLTNDPLEAQVHMQMLMEIRAETLAEYLASFRGQGRLNGEEVFERVVGFRPTGWNYRPPTSRFTENPAISTVLHSEGWKSKFTMRDLVPGRGSTRESNCFGVPYSEHSSFRELTMFCTSLRIGKVVPTVNVGSARSREKMKGWIEKWEMYKKKEGLFKVDNGAEGW